MNGKVGKTRAEIREIAGASAQAEELICSSVVVDHVSDLDSASATSVVFATTADALLRALRTEAALILAPFSLRDAAEGDSRVLWTEDARLGFALVARQFATRLDQSQIDPTAQIDASAILGSRVRVRGGVVIGPSVVVGDDCVLDARVVVYEGTVLGKRVVVQAGAVLGSAGFGYVLDPATREYVMFPQQGRLVIEDDVHIGANATIDRGALGETRIGQGTKIDNLVHIAHNCQIGQRVLIAAQAGIAGSSRINDEAVVAGQVGIADHVEIGPGVILGAKSGVPSGKKLSGKGQLFWGIPARPIGQYLRELAWLRRQSD